MHTKNLYENGPNPFFFFGTKNMSEGHLMHTVLVCYFFDKLVLYRIGQGFHNRTHA